VTRATRPHPAARQVDLTREAPRFLLGQAGRGAGHLEHDLVSEGRDLNGGAVLAADADGSGETLVVHVLLTLSIVGLPAEVRAPLQGFLPERGG
jgi:hypothetical protein